MQYPIHFKLLRRFWSQIQQGNWSLMLSLLVISVMVNPVKASLLDEIQVYTDDINAAGETGLELHINTTPKGIDAPSYPGELTNNHGFRLTPEFSLGLSPTTELGLYLPTTRANDGNWYLAGAKVRFKWLPIQASEHSGWFAGVNFELGQLKQVFSQSTRAVEVRNIIGWKDEKWLLAVNPILGWDVSPGYVHHSPDLTMAYKISRKVTDQQALGVEYYNGRGRMNDPLAPSLQNNQVFLVLDHEGKPFNFNFGIGKGQTQVSDSWTIKGIIEVPFQP
jgi:hypothetical protein